MDKRKKRVLYAVTIVLVCAVIGLVGFVVWKIGQSGQGGPTPPGSTEEGGEEEPLEKLARARELAAAGEDKEAEELYRELLADKEKLEGQVDIADLYLECAACLLNRDKPDKAAALLQEGMEYQGTPELEKLLEDVLAHTFVTARNECARESEDRVYYHEYDREGREVCLIYYEGEQEIQRTEKSYDENGNVTGVCVYRNGSENVTDRTQYSYNEEGMPVSEAIYNGAGEAVWSSEYRYGSNGMITEYLERSGNGALSFRREYAYDAQGNLEKTVEYQGSYANMEYSGELTEIGYQLYSYEKKNGVTSSYMTGYITGEGACEKREEVYDEKGQRTEKRYYGADGELLEETFYTYNEAGQITEERIDGYYGDTTRQSIRTEYDEDGKVLRIVREMQGNIVSEDRYTYDVFGNISSISYEDKENNTQQQVNYLYAYHYEP